MLPERTSTKWGLRGIIIPLTFCFITCQSLTGDDNILLPKIRYLINKTLVGDVILFAWEARQNMLQLEKREPSDLLGNKCVL